MASSKVTKASWLTNVLLTLTFSCFLFQFSIEYAGQGISANYLFVLSPLILFFFPKQFIMPSNFLIACALFYIAIFVFAVFTNHDDNYFLLRRFLSFASFCSIFSLAIINFSKKDMKCFFAATIVISCLITFNGIFELLPHAKSVFIHGFAKTFILENGYSPKDLVGSNRIGFVLILGMASVLTLTFTGRFSGFIQGSLLAIIFIGILLTFSRSSGVALIAGVIVFPFVAPNGIKTFTQFPEQKIIGILTFIALVCMFLSFYSSVLLFYFQRLFWFFGSAFFYGIQNALSGHEYSVATAIDLNVPNSSENFRFVIAKDIIEKTILSPISGSGFQGVWVLNDEKAGSAHSQYGDVVYRTGFIGLVIYLILLFRISKACLSQFPICFAGFISILVFGLFNETFKESHGAFILAMFVAYFLKSEKSKFES